MTAAAARRDTVSNSGRTQTGTSRASRSTRSAAPTTPSRVVRPQLRVLDQEALRRRARRRNLAMTMFIVVIIGFFAAALAQAQLVANQQELDVLQSRIAIAEAERARLERAVDESSAPAAIIQRAETLGMVRANEPVYLAAVSPAPEIMVVSTLGSVSASTAGVEVTIDGGLDNDVDLVAAAGIGGDSGLDPASSIESGGGGGGIAAPLIASIAGTRAVASGIGSG